MASQKGRFIYLTNGYIHMSQTYQIGMSTLRGKLLGLREPKLIILILFITLYWYFIITQFTMWKVGFSRPCRYTTVIHEHNGKNHTYNRYSPFIFIGGFPRSGTTLLRAMLDAHDDIRCGEETRVLPRILALADKIQNRKKEWNRLLEAGLTENILNNAMANYILQIIVKHGDPAPRICNKDPFTLKYGVYLQELFPNMKFIFMIRDGRAVVHSMITRKVTITGYNLSDYRDCLTRWSHRMNTMLDECEVLGPSNCLKVKYEELVLHPKSQMERILKYLQLPWTDKVLHHEQFINTPGGVSLSKMERSTDQVIKPVNIEALTKWVGKIPDDVIADMDIVAPVLKKLGYDPAGNPPNYGGPDPEVAANTNNVIKQKKKWKEVAESVLKKSKVALST